MGVYSPVPCDEVYCVRLNFIIKIALLATCPSLPFCTIMSTQQVQEEALLIVRCILCLLVVNVGEVVTASKKSENTKTL